MDATNHTPIGFPGIFPDWKWNPDPVAIHIGHGVYWYGIIIAAAAFAAYILCSRQADRYGLTKEHVLDLVLWGVPFGIVGARFYYVAFHMDIFRAADGALDLKKIIAIWDGGLAIYGGIIAGILVAFFYTRYRRIRFGALTDLASLGLLLGQSIGRWGNFINREAFGSETNLPWRMRLWLDAEEYIDVHPTFLYESLWNLAGFLFILLFLSRKRKFDGETTLFYFFWYGLGRLWIEGLRTDSLYFFDWTLFGVPLRVSQVLSLALVLISSILLVYHLRFKRHTVDELWVNQKQSVTGKK